jgi:hypothetical protein
MEPRFASIYPFIDYLQARGVELQADGNGRWKCRCPAHDDKDPSLKIRVQNGQIQVTCFAGCQRDDILKAWGLTRPDMWLDGRKARKKERTEVEIDYDNPDAVYSYTDRDGNLKYQALRFQLGGKKKTFRQRRPNPDKPDEWVWNIDGIDLYLYHLPDVIKEVERGETVVYVEGEKDVLNLRKLGVCATCHSGGSKHWNDSLINQLAGSDLIVVPDKDKGGMTQLENICRTAPGVVKRLRILVLPGDAKDSTDWIEEGHSKVDWDKLVDTAPDYTPELVADLIAQYRGTLPEVVVTDKHMREVTTEALAILHKRNNPARIFRRSDSLTRVCADEANRPYTEAMGEAAFRGELDRCCNFVRLSTKGDSIPIPPPLEVVRDGLTRPNEWQFPPLLGITEAPVLRPDGTILDKPGYDEATKLYYYPSPGLEVPLIPEKCGDSQLQDAAKLVVEALTDFPFDSKASWCNAIGTMLAPILRPMISGPIPMALFDKPQQGTGATLMAETISTIATGRPAAMMTAPADDEGWRKAITSLLVKGQLVCTIDNVEGDLWAPSLAALLTLMTWQDRILGVSKMIELPHRSVWICTGNNIHLKGDLPRRCVWCRMDAGVARPWMRTLDQFAHPDLRGWVLDTRGAILAAILTVAREWVRAGKPIPKAIPILGGYESYCQVISGVLDFIGAQGFMGNLEDMYNEADTETPQWEVFLETWHEILKEEAYTSAELIGYINDSTELQGALPDALAYVMEKRGHGEVKNYGVRLGQRLTHYNGRQYPNGCVLRKAGTKKRAVTWQVVRLGSLTTSPKFTLQGEVGEVRTTLTCGEKTNQSNNNKIDNKGTVVATSPTSPLATKQGDVVPKKRTPIRIPPYPKAPCRCGNHKFWLRPSLPGKADEEWMCPTCSPPPKHLKGLTWYLVPPKQTTPVKEVASPPPDCPPYPASCPVCGGDLFILVDNKWQCCGCNPVRDGGE